VVSRRVRGELHAGQHGHGRDDRAASTECTAYASGTRPTYDEAASASQVTTNAASRASFVFNATKTIYGGFLISNSTKGGTTGTLFAAAQFATSKAVVSGDELLLTYAFTSTSV
jgi:phage baseplate assembly protein gpV